MKQCITKKQLDERGGTHIKGKPKHNPNIGEMVEFLGSNIMAIRNDNGEWSLHCKETIYIGKELCDVL